jgi:metal-responsive CopG/Arc/MetJ family transcriptional regulator
MKIAISIPDGVFHAAEQTAKRLSISRSALYTKAVEAFLEAHRTEGVTEKLNEVYGTEPACLDPLLARMQAASTVECGTP